MFLIKLATVMAFLVALLVICMLVKAIADQQKQMLILKRKNAALMLEVDQRENVLGLQADFEAILEDGEIAHCVHGEPKPVRAELTLKQKECCSWLQQEREKLNPSLAQKS